jgi:hypothetical protein
MKRVVVVAIVLALAFSASAFAASKEYGGPYWSAGQTSGSSFSPSWVRNAFYKGGEGFDTTVTFIDNVSYGWHSTVRNTGLSTTTWWFSSQIKKAHCRANVGGFSGNCWVYS